MHECTTTRFLTSSNLETHIFKTGRNGTVKIVLKIDQKGSGFHSHKLHEMVMLSR